MIALANAEPGGDFVETLLADPDNDCYAHAVNLCEAYYDACRRDSAASAENAMALLRRSGLLFRSDMHVTFWQEAGRLKARVKRISLADCFGLTLTARLNAEFVTADRHELERLTGEFRIRFIR